MSSETPTPETKPSDISKSSPPTTNQVPPPEPAFGFTAYAEQINGRFAMLGFVILLLLELFTHKDLFTWLGLR
jgi:hypothetical protein